MDLLAKRYASPFAVLEEMIRLGRFYEFVLEINAITAEESREEKLWEIWLHKIFGQGWDEWRRSIRTQSEEESATESELEATVKESQALLNSFNPTN